MADFCQFCSIDLFGEDTKDLALAEGDKKRGTLKEGEGWIVLCESCGPILVDDEGKCMSHTETEHETLAKKGHL